MQLLPIVYASDNNQIDLLKISIFSALKNKADSTQYEFFILSRDIDYLHQLEIKKLCNIYHATINFIDCAPYEKKYHFTDEELKQLKVRVLLPSVTFYRLIIDEVVPFREKIIYIDNDTLILKDLTDLYNTTITTRYGMVKEVNHPIQRWTSKEGTVTDYCYNAGVMLINNNFPSTLSIEDMFKEVIKYRRHDQDFLNYFCWNDITALSFWYNFQLHFSVERLHYLLPGQPPTTDVITEVRALDDKIKRNYLNHIYILHYAHLHIKLKPNELFNDNFPVPIINAGEHIDYLLRLRTRFSSWINFAFAQTQNYHTYRKAYELWGSYWLEYKKMLSNVKT